MKKNLEYKGYNATVQYSLETSTYQIKIENTQNKCDFESNTLVEAEQQFRTLIDKGVIQHHENTHNAPNQPKPVMTTTDQLTMQVSTEKIKDWELNEWHESYTQNLIKHFGKTKFEVGEILEYRDCSTSIEWDEKEQMFCWFCIETHPGDRFVPYYASSPEMIAQEFIWSVDTHFENEEYERLLARVGDTLCYRGSSVMLEYNERTKFFYGSPDAPPDSIITKCKTVEEFNTKFRKYVDDYLDEENL